MTAASRVALMAENSADSLAVPKAEHWAERTAGMKAVRMAEPKVETLVEHLVDSTAALMVVPTVEPMAVH